jgi:hypothetical protein
VRGDKIEKLARRNNFGLLPKAGKVTEIACNEIVGTNCFGTLEENIVIGIGSHFEAARRFNHMRSVLKELK